MTPNLPKRWFDLPIAAIDVETTSLDASTGRIVEIGIVRFEQGKVVDTYNVLIDPEMPLPEETTRITGIKPEDVEGQPNFAARAKEIDDRLKDVAILAYNLSFDKGFVDAELQRCGYSWPEDAILIDPLIIARKLIPGRGNKKLTQMCQRYDIPLENAHRANEDAEAAGHLFYKFAELYSNQIPEDLEEFQKVLAIWAHEQEMNRKNRYTSKATFSHKVETGLGSKFIYGTESDPLRALYQTVPEAPTDK